jgi:hypothetical protein
VTWQGSDELLPVLSVAALSKIGSNDHFVLETLFGHLGGTMLKGFARSRRKTNCKVSKANLRITQVM